MLVRNRRLLVEVVNMNLSQLQHGFVKVFTWICQSCYIYFQTRRLIDLRDGRPQCKAYAYSKTMALRLQPFLELFLLKQDHWEKIDKLVARTSC